ncbi:MAG: ABC transporter permease [Chitinophagaceae bacterium]|nr:ABC transporter permease [Chitinophagaceae bacterium]
MIRNYFKTALRNLWKNKVTSFINLFGLSIGMTATVFIFLWVQNEFSFDNFQPGKNNIYRITNTLQVTKDEAWIWENSPMPLAEAAVKEIPGINKAARAIANTYGGIALGISNKLFAEKTTAWVDNGWFNIFHYDFIAGSASNFSRGPFNIILTESKAKKYFGETNPIGQLIRVDTVNYTVQGVVKDNPVNSSFQFDVMLQLEGRFSDPKRFKNDNTWNNFNYLTFLALQPGANIYTVQSKLNALLNKSKSHNTAVISLEPLSKMYFETDLQNSNLPHGNQKTTLIFGMLGFLLVITACINYVNLTTAKASLRAKEVSVRKIVGAKRGHLFFQFVAESLAISLMALVITLVLVKLFLPVFNMLTEEHFLLPLNSLAMWKVLAGTLFFATILNGIYPAVMLSSFKPMSVFRGRSVLKLNDGFVRKGLVVFQFVLSIILIIGTIVIYRQLHYIQTNNPGYNISQVMAVQIPYKTYGALKDDERKQFFNGMKQELQSKSGITAVSTGGSEIENVGNSSSGNADWDGRDTTFNPTISRLSVDEDFQKMFALRLESGQWFRPGNADQHNFILNETAVATFNMHKPLLGQRFTMGGDTGKIIAVVKDFHFKSMHEKIGPLVLSNNNGSDSYFFIKTLEGNIPKSVNAAEAIWTKFIPAEPFTYTFLDDSFNKLYKSDIKTSQLIFIFSIIAIVISALGLFGLATFTAEQRTKEIGIRKVLGATVRQITTLLSKDFVLLVIIALVIASPVAWWAMNKWLEDFAYRVNVGLWVFVIAGALAIMIAMLTVSFQAIKAAVANPVKSLRSE